jgi:hypothetical protein
MEPLVIPGNIHINNRNSSHGGDEKGTFVQQISSSHSIHVLYSSLYCTGERCRPIREGRARTAAWYRATRRHAGIHRSTSSHFLSFFSWLILFFFPSSIFPVEFHFCRVGIFASSRDLLRSHVPVPGSQIPPRVRPSSPLIGQ